MAFILFALFAIGLANFVQEYPKPDDTCGNAIGCSDDDKNLLSSALKPDHFILPSDSILHPKPSKPIKWTEFDCEKFIGKGRLEVGEDPYKANQFNQSASDAIRYDRELPDTRKPVCKDKEYDIDRLPLTSIVIIYYNEARSTLLRTVLSIFNRTPPELNLEMNLVDDCSDDASIDEELSVLEKVKVLRNTKRQGLIRARLRGAALARAPVLMFFDSHCECNVDWLPPLLSRIVENPKTLVSPVIDNIKHDTFTLEQAVNPEKVSNGIWYFDGRKSVQKRKQPAYSIHTPLILGGEFAISRRWFYKVGAYDEDMEIWGAEHLEQGFRLWMCGGRLEIILCSRVGHVYRKKFPFSFPGNGASTVVKRNTRRMVEVWLGDYKHLYYRHVPMALTVDYGDISQRLALKEKLQCEDFDWYLKNVYPELRVPIAQPGRKLEIRYDRFCLDLMDKHEPGDEGGLFRCHGTGNNQEWVYNEDTGDLMNTATYHCMIINDKGKFVVIECDKAEYGWFIAPNSSSMVSFDDQCLVASFKDAKAKLRNWWWRNAITGNTGIFG